MKRGCFSDVDYIPIFGFKMRFDGNPKILKPKKREPHPNVVFRPWWLYLHNATMSSVHHVPELYEYMKKNGAKRNEGTWLQPFGIARGHKYHMLIQLTPNFFVFSIPTVNTHSSNCTMTHRSSTGALWTTTWGNPCLCSSFSPVPCGGPSRCVTALKFVSAQNATVQKLNSVIKHKVNQMMLFW